MNSGNISNEEKTKQKFEIDNLKSNIVFKQIVNYIKKTKFLEIMRHNKKLQKRLNLSINDYKEYSQIEIELKLIDNNYGRFINLPDEQQKYYHIFFDNSSEEIKRNYLNENEKVKTIKILIDFEVKSFRELFSNTRVISSINFINFKRKNINNMSHMFYECSSLKELNLSNFITNNVTDMSYTFAYCSSLEELNLSNFNTNNVTNMKGMFSHCSSLKELNLSNFNTNNVTNMSDMFCECSSLKELNLSNFYTNNVTDMCYMFCECSSLKELNLSNFNTNNVIYMRYMFEGCSEKLMKKIKEKNKSIMI